MLKLNNKGFAVSTILYGSLTLIILILMLIFGVMKSNKDMNNDLVENLTDSMNNCAHVEAKLESCYFSNTDCSYLKQLYEECAQDEGKNIGLFADKILLDNNGGEKDNNIYFSKISSDTNGKGLYYTSTNTEGNKTTYYFRGNVDNNYVKFGKEGTEDIYWRIVRINEDGSVRLIYAGNSVDATGDAATIGNSQFNTYLDNGSSDNAQVGYMYGLTGQTGGNAYELTHSNDNSNTIKTFIDNWYTNNTNLSSYKDSYLADAGFCNDRSVAEAEKLWYYLNETTYDTALGYGIKFTWYGAYNRFVNLKQPQFKCPNADNDLFTLKGSAKGNAALDNPIGLLTIDEVTYAGLTYESANSNYYLYTGANYWTMSPENWQFGTASIWYVGTDSSWGMTGGYMPNGVRPVVNLQSSVIISLEGTGDPGTKTNPYIIK